MSKERTTDKAFPISYEGWDEAGGDYGDIQFYKAEFTEDFGPVKKGDKFDCVIIYHSQSKLVCIINGPESEGGFSPQIGEIVVPFKVLPA